MRYWIAVVDDDAANQKAADHILSSEGYEVSCFSSGEELLEFLSDSHPDLILMDYHMPGMNGLETMQKMRSMVNGCEIPVIVLTADNDSDTEVRALSAGAMDFAAKPFVPAVLLLRVRQTLELIRLQKDQRSEITMITADSLKEHERNERLSLQIVQTLAGTIDAKDSYTNGHSVRVAEYARMIAKAVGYSEHAQQEIYMIGLLHDVGKIGVPDTIINKRSRLTGEEYAIIKTHPVVGHDILRNITEMPKLAVGARWHHERYDGKGYPDGLAGTDIPEEARIIAVADAYDAMSSRRSYHEIYPQEHIIQELRNGKGTQFDPLFADVMLDLIASDRSYQMREIVAEQAESKPAPLPDKLEPIDRLRAAGFNTEEGIRFCMDDKNFYFEMLKDFANSVSERRSKMNFAYERHDWITYSVHVHALKSAAKTVGADLLSEMAKNLEDAAKKGDGEFILAHHAPLLQALQEACAQAALATA